MFFVCSKMGYRTMPIEQHFDIGLIAQMALKEKQIQQNYRPIIAVHKWFARRPGTLFRGLILSEFADRPLAETYFAANDFPGRLIVDPFMGGGTPILEAPRRVRCAGFRHQSYGDLDRPRGDRTPGFGYLRQSGSFADL